jgi:hypothetical protein
MSVKIKWLTIDEKVQILEECKKTTRRFGSCLKSKLTYSYTCARFYVNVLGKHMRVTNIVRIFSIIGSEWERRKFTRF